MMSALFPGHRCLAITGTVMFMFTCAIIVEYEHVERSTIQIKQTVQQIWRDNTDWIQMRGTPQFLRHLYFGHNTSDTLIQETDTEVCTKRVPSALIIGAAKCGTAALLRFLGHHPSVVSCLHPGEPAYFQTHKYANGLDWYRNIMPCSYSNQITIEKSPQYFPSYICAKRIYEFNRNIKLLLILKDPVEKAISKFVHMKSFKQIQKQLSFEDYMTDNTSDTGLNIARHILHEGQYAHNMEMYLLVFNRSQIHIVDGHELEKNPATELNKVETFLDLPAYFTPELFKLTGHRGKYCFVSESGSPDCLGNEKGRPHPEVSDSLRDKLRTYYQPWNVIFFQMINATLNWGY